MAQLLSSLSVGSVVKFGKVLGSPIRWIVVDKNHAGYPANSVTLFAEKMVKLGIYDGAEAGNTNSRYAYGNNDYLTSNVDQWLNKDGVGGAWWTAAHSLDAPPTNANTYGNGGTTYNGYANDPAFLNQFTTEEKNAILSTKLFQQDDNSYRKVFLLSCKELGFASYGDYYDTAIAYFDSDTKRAGTHTAESLAENESTFASNYYWTRTKSNTSEETLYTYVNVVMNNGTRGQYMAAFVGTFGIRPALNLLNTVRVNDTPDADGAYQVIFNEAPTAPVSISVPTQILGGRTAVISWGAATDVDNNISGYQLERSVDGGAWTQVYRGALRSFTDTITHGWRTVAYRVACYDLKGLYGAYTTSATRTITNNNAPVFNRASGDLGTIGTAFAAQSYTVTDATGDTITVIEKFDGTIKRTYTATSGVANTFSFTADEWLQVLNGAHTIEITATDQYGDKSTVAWTFTKAVNTATVVISPITVDTMPKRCVVGVNGSFPASSVLTIEVCNNANDATPTWEDISLKIGEKHFFNNAIKTAANWAVGLRVMLERRTAVGNVYIDFITINFD